MTCLTGTRLARYELVTAAHEFILTGLPFRHVHSRQALDRFLEAANGCRLSTPELDAVLVTLLSVLEPHAHGRLPSLVDRYVGQRRHLSEPIDRFRHSVEDVIRYRGVGSWDVQQAIAIIEDRFAECELTQASVARQLTLSPQELSSLFTAQTGHTFSEYLRDVRLDRAARLLATDAARIKEIWACVGYNDASNFGHQFRRRFDATPGEYRARAIRLAMPAGAGVRSTDIRAGGDRTLGAVLVVDDNACTRDTLALYLRACGYCVALAATGEAALREAGRFAPDAIVLDHHLPDMDGFDCLRGLRRQRPSAWPGVLLFTADWEIADQAAGIRALGAMFISKLSDLEEVERLIASLLGMRSTLGPLPVS